MPDVMDQYFRIIHGMVVGLCWFYVFFVGYVLGLPSIAVGGAACSLVATFSPWIKKRFGHTWGVNIFVSAAFFWEMLFICHTGGIFSVCIPWVSVIPFVAGIFLGRKGANSWTLVCVSVILGMGAFPNLLPVNLLSQDRANWFTLSTFFGIGSFLLVSLRFGSLISEARVQEKLFETSKMSSLGEMASGIGHEINNPLAIIIGKASLLRKHAEKNAFDQTTFKDNLSKIEQTANRIAKIIKGLKSYSRNSEADPMEQIAVASLIEESLELCRTRFKNKSIELRVNVNTTQNLECRAAQISQIIVNLLGNAHDAVEKLSVKWVQLDVVNTTKTLIISVTDSGCGIPAEIATKLMQPFFTTKGVGKGTGLGLSISKGIAETHNGTLRIDQHCKNTRFVLELPLLQPQSTRESIEKIAC